MDKEIIEKLINYRWFRPKALIEKKDIENLVKEHIKRLKPFGFGKQPNIKFIEIWSGESPEEVIKIRKELQKSSYQLVIDNILGIIRELAVEKERMDKIDLIVREVENKIKNIAKEGAIDSAGLTVRSTLSLKVIKPDEETSSYISDFDVVEKCAEEAALASGWYISWKAVEDLITHENPFEPLLEIYNKGLWPLGVLKNEFIIIVPNSNNTKLI